MGKSGEPAVYRPDVSHVVCLRCMMSVSVENRGASLRLLYDMEQWQRSACWSHLDGPVNCCWFDDLKRVVDELSLLH
jgi:hypothetical protein